MRVDFQERLAQVLVQARRFRGAGHGVPLIADASSVQPERKARRCFGDRRAGGNRDHASVAAGGIELAVCKEPHRLAAHSDRPTRRHQRVITALPQPGQARDVKVPPHRSRKPGQRGVFVKDLRGAGVGKGFGPAHAAAHVRHDIPIGAGLPCGGHQGALAADGAVRVCDRAVLFAPPRRGQQHMGQPRGVGVCGYIADNGEIAAFDRIADHIGVGHRHGGVGADDPQCLDLASADLFEQIDGLEPRAFGHGGGIPEITHKVAVNRVL